MVPVGQSLRSPTARAQNTEVTLHCLTRSLPRRDAIKQEVEAFAEGAVPVVFQQGAGALDGGIERAGTGQALLRGGPAIV
jgi:hypothetical protein